MHALPSKPLPTAMALAALLSTMVAMTTLVSGQRALASEDGDDAPRTQDTARVGETVNFKTHYPAGAIVVVNDDRHLFYVLGAGKAIRYPIAIGTPEEQWTGRTFVEMKAVEPSWTPPWDVDNPVAGGDGNPLGARAIYLGWTLYRIHGTNAPGSIGSAASHGCFRMLNANVKDLFDRVHLGAPVFVVDTLDGT